MDFLHSFIGFIIGQSFTIDIDIDLLEVFQFFDKQVKDQLFVLVCTYCFPLGITTSSFLEKSVQISSQRLPLIWEKVNVAMSEKVSVR